MKKRRILIIITLFLGACAQKETPKTIQNKIIEYKEKIIELQKQLDTMQTGITKNNSVNVRVVVLKKKPLTHYFKATAYIQAKEQANISPEMNGEIKHIYVKEGQFVKKGQILIQLNATVLQSSIEEVKTGLDLATTIYNKQKKLWDKKIGKELDYLEAKNRKESLNDKLKTLNAQLDMAIIKAPFSGITDEIYLKEGELASPGRPIINLVNLHRMEADADVSEKYLPDIHAGDSVLLSFPAYPEADIRTKVARTGNVVNSINRTFQVQVDFNNTKNEIKPNMIAQIRMSDYKGNDISVPSIIVKKDTKGDYVFIAEKNNNNYTAKKVYVETSFPLEDKIIIKKGLKEGDSVIVEGYNLVSNNQKVTIK